MSEQPHQEPAERMRAPHAHGGLLSQEEIQAVLGLNRANVATEAPRRYAPRTQANRPMVRFVQFLQSSMHALVALPVAVKFTGSPAADESGLVGSAMSAPFWDVQGDAFGVVSVDADFVDALVSSVFGTRRGGATRAGYPALEQALVKRALDSALAGLGGALKPWFDVSLVLGHLEVGPHDESLVLEAAACGIETLPAHGASAAVMRVSLAGRRGLLRLSLSGALGQRLGGSKEPCGRRVSAAGYTPGDDCL